MRPITLQRRFLYDMCILSSVLAAAVITWLFLSRNMYEILPLFYLVPVILVAFFRPKLGICVAVLAGWLYLALIFIIAAQPSMLAVVWFCIFVSLGVLVSAWSQVYHKAGKQDSGMYSNPYAGAFRFDGRNLKIIDANDRFASILQCECQTLLNKSLPDLIPEEERLQDFLFQLRNPRRVRGIEASLLAADGTVRWVLIQPADSNAVSIDCIVTDITENKQMQDALMQANRKLNLLNNVTRHDILNQLTVLMGYLGISRHDTTDPELLKYIAKEEKAANAIQRLILFTRDYQDIGVHSPTWQDVAETASLAIATIDLRNIGVSLDLRQVLVFADPLLEKVFYNLVENSVRHGGKVTRITIRAEENADGMDLIIEDDGVGIPQAAKEKIFRREYFKNTGFGLFFTRDILAITGLTITENGTPGSSARFVIHAPKGAFRIGSVIQTA